jgi:hypothetical protein
VDAYGHLITTSTENLHSPIYEKMDYLQPHLYAANMTAASRTYETAPSDLGKPVFYGEEGDDHQPLAAEVKKSGLDIVPTVWASIMGQGEMAAQPWDGWRMLEQGRLDELGAVFRFQAINRVAVQGELKPFSSVVECKERFPMRIVAGQFWQRRAAPDFDYPVDGTEPLDAANVPATLVGSAASRADGYPGQATYHLDLAQTALMVAHVYSVAEAGGGLAVSVDGTVVASHVWAAGKGAPGHPNLEFSVPAGKHTLLLSNPGPDWVGVSAVDMGMDTPALALIGRRNDHFIEAWVWNKPNLYLPTPYPAVSGVVDLDNVPAGSWKVTWWDTQKGVASESKVVVHPGGTLRLETPPIVRHAALALTRTP